MPPPRLISLIGYSGTGKSTVARLVAERLGWGAADLDAEIERATGRAISDIFARDGEAAFRRLEVRTLTDLAGGTNRPLVVALGGGAVLSDEVRALIAREGLVVCLDGTVDALRERLLASAGQPGAERPLIATGSAAEMERFKAARAALYALADFTVRVDALTPEEVSAEVTRLVLNYGERAFNRPGRAEALAARPSVMPPVVEAPGAAVIVRAASGQYGAYAGWGELERLGEHVARATGARRAFVVSDAAVLAHWGEVSLGSLRGAGIDAVATSVSAGDASKDLASAGLLYSWLAANRAERRDAVVALGGGMVGDLAGFVAATYVRGMPLVQAPTSLLAMVDASIGGKTAINHAGAKNLVGAFYQPRAVVADVATLKTLPKRQFVEGLGEVVKHALIADEGLLSLLEERLDDLLALDPEVTTDIVRRNVRIKAAVVSQDERETGGVRETLNYGHTLGHAFEAAGDYEALLHGEAVAAGMMAAAEIGRRMGVTPSALVARQKALLERASLPLRPPAGLDGTRIRAATALDKKVVAGMQRWVLLEDVGRPVIRDDVPGAIVNEVLDELLA